MDLIYGDKLKAEGIANELDIKRWEKEYTDTLNQHFELAKAIKKLSIMDWIDTPWTGFFESVDPKKVIFKLKHFEVEFFSIVVRNAFSNLPSCFMESACDVRVSSSRK